MLYFYAKSKTRDCFNEVIDYGKQTCIEDKIMCN